MRSRQKFCARCLRTLRKSEACASQVKSPDRHFVLCEHCLVMENNEIGETGSKDLPDRLRQYKANQPYDL